MKEDPLKRYTDDNREEFESFEQPDFGELWENIAEALDEKEQRPQTKPRSLWGNRLWVRAAAIVLLGIGLGWIGLNFGGSSVYSSEWAETQQYYQETIEVKMHALEARKEAIDPTIFKDLEALDLALQELKTDLKDQADNEEVVNAMIVNYQIKLKILEEILEELKQEDSHEKHKEKGNSDPQA